jgi:hypothetical protein
MGLGSVIAAVRAPKVVLPLSFALNANIKHASFVQGIEAEAATHEHEITTVV